MAVQRCRSGSRSGSPGRSRSGGNAVPNLSPTTSGTRTAILNARGTELVVPLDALQRIPYFQARMKGGWFDSDAPKAYLNINPSHMHAILDILEYSRQGDAASLEAFIPSGVPVVSILGAARMLGLVRATPEADAPDSGGFNDPVGGAFDTLPRLARMEMSMHSLANAQDCRMCGNPFVPELNTPLACACHPVDCLASQSIGVYTTFRCTRCTAVEVRNQQRFCYRGPHLPKPRTPPA